MQHDRNNLRH